MNRLAQRAEHAQLPLLWLAYGSLLGHTLPNLNCITITTFLDKIMFGEDGEIPSSILPSQDESKCQLSRRQQRSSDLGATTSVNYETRMESDRTAEDPKCQPVPALGGGHEVRWPRAHAGEGPKSMYTKPQAQYSIRHHQQTNGKTEDRQIIG